MTLNRPVITVDFTDATQALTQVRIRNNDVQKYNEDFQKALQTYEVGVEQFCTAKLINQSALMLQPAVVNTHYLNGLKHIEWFRTWEAQYQVHAHTLEQMASSILLQKLPLFQFQNNNNQQSK